MKTIFTLFSLFIISLTTFGQTVELQRTSFLQPELYSISGTAFLEQLDSGELQFRLSDDFTTPWGPDVRILLNSSISGNGGVELVNLTTLDHFDGGLTIDVPSDVDIEDYDFVVFFCVAFNQLWSSGELDETVDLTGGNEITCETSSVENQNGSDSIDICPDDNSDNVIFFENSLDLPAGDEYAYLITDANEIVQEIITDDNYDFEGTDFEEQRVYGLHYSGTLNEEIGSNRFETTASDCFEHSIDQDYITITKNACFICESSEVSISDGSFNLDICPSDNMSDFVFFSNSLNINDENEYAYLLTDRNEILQEVIFDDFYDFEGTSLDEQRVYGIHYNGFLDIQIGSDRFQTTASDCFEHSNEQDFITITKNACAVCETSGVNSPTGNNFDICPSDNTNDIITLSNTLNINDGDQYAYLITDANEILEEVVFNNSYNFEGSSEQEQRVYGIHYDGTLSAAIGSHRSATTASGCFEHSNDTNFIRVTKDACITPFECLTNEVSSPNGLNYNICNNDGNPDPVTLSNTLGLTAGINYAYLITDNNEILQEVILTDIVDFEGSNLESQRVYGLHYSGTLNPQIGQNRLSTSASECFTHSNSNTFISISNNACPPTFDCLASSVNSQNQSNISICTNDGNNDIVQLNNSLNANPGLHYAYLITDASDILIDVSLNSQFDFETVSQNGIRVHGIHYDGDLLPQIGQNRMQTSATECFVHSSGFLTIVTDDCIVPAVCFPSSVSTTTGTTTFNFCPEDGISDVIELTNNIPADATGNYAYLITNENEILEEVILNSSINFEGSGLNTQRVYGIYYEGTLDPRIGFHRNQTNASECFMHSSASEFVTITKNACPPPFVCEASFTFTNQGQETVVICPNDGQEDLVSFNNNLTASLGQNYAYLITDVNEVLLEVSTATVMNFEGSSTDQQRIYGIHYDGDLNPAIGQIRTATTATGCFTHSDGTRFLTIAKDGCQAPFECQENLTATTDWATEVNICPNDGIDDLILLRNSLFIESGEHYAYLITDADGIVQEVTLDSVYNFEGSNFIEQRVYGIHYDGELFPVIGAHRTETTASGCFTHSGDSLFLTINKSACVSTFECLDNLTATTDWATQVDICPNDGVDDFIALRNSLFIESGEHYAYLITDAEGIVQEVTLDSIYNFEGSSFVEQRVYGIHYDGELFPVIGEHRTATTASGCFTHSGDNLFLTISKTNCPSSFECVESLTATEGWVTQVDICAGDESDDFIILKNNINVAPGENYAFLITDEFEVLQEVVFDSLYNFDNTGTEVQRVYGISYAGELFPMIGEDRKSTNASDCHIHSGDDFFLTINKTAACTTATSDIDRSNEINVFPNPTNGEINIEYDQAEFDFERLEIYNASGKVIQRLEGYEIDNTINIVEPGLYLLRFENNDESLVKKVIVQ